MEQVSRNVVARARMSGRMQVSFKSFRNGWEHVRDVNSCPAWIDLGTNPPLGYNSRASQADRQTEKRSISTA